MLLPTSSVSLVVSYYSQHPEENKTIRNHNWDDWVQTVHTGGKQVCFEQTLDATPTSSVTLEVSHYFQHPEEKKQNEITLQSNCTDFG